MLQHFDSNMKVFDEALEEKEYATAATIQGYLIGVMQCVIIAYKHYGYQKLPQKVEKRLEKIQSPVE